MKKISGLILCFLIGFYGTTLLTDTGELLLIKSRVFFGGVLIATILKIIDDVKQNK